MRAGTKEGVFIDSAQERAIVDNVITRLNSLAFGTMSNLGPRPTPCAEYVAFLLMKECEAKISEPFKDSESVLLQYAKCLKTVWAPDEVLKSVATTDERATVAIKI